MADTRDRGSLKQLLQPGLSLAFVSPHLQLILVRTGRHHPVRCVALPSTVATHNGGRSNQLRTCTCSYCTTFLLQCTVGLRTLQPSKPWMLYSPILVPVSTRLGTVVLVLVPVSGILGSGHHCSLLYSIVYRERGKKQLGVNRTFPPCLHLFITCNTRTSKIFFSSPLPHPRLPPYPFNVFYLVAYKVYPLNLGLLLNCFRLLLC
jgi:hypothetical protein